MPRLQKNDYKEYIDSPAWQKFRDRYGASEYPKECLICQNRQYQLHHCTYKRLGHELLTDVVPLCCDCHKELHARYRKTQNLYQFSWDYINGRRRARRLPELSPFMLPKSPRKTKKKKPIQDWGAEIKDATKALRKNAWDMAHRTPATKWIR